VATKKPINTPIIDDQLFSQWPDGVILLNEAQQVVYANGNAESLLGYNKAELIAKDAHTTLCAPSSDYQHDLGHCPLNPQNEVDKNELGETWWIKKSGIYVHIDLRIVSLNLDSQEYTLLTFQDCSNRHYSERELKRLALYAELNPSPIIEFNETGLIYYSNPAMLEQMSEIGFDDDGIPFILPNNVQDIVQQCLKSGETVKNIETASQDCWYLWNFHPVLERSLVQGYAVDITQRKKAEQILFEEKNKFLVTLESIMDGVVTVDKQQRISYINPDASRLSGYSIEDAINKPIGEIIRILNPSSKNKPDNIVHSCLQQGRVITFNDNMFLYHKDGYVTTVKQVVAPMYDHNKKVIGAVVVLHDVSESHQLAQKLSYQASHDSLTGLINRREFEIRLEQFIDRTRTDRSQHVMLYIDMDNFKIINDTCGHVAGDQLLRQISDLLERKLRRGDVLSRLGGDEFGIILDSCPVDIAEKIAKSICAEINEYHFAWESHVYKTAASIGLVTINEESEDVNSILRLADSTCYAAKDFGKSRVHIYQADDEELMQKQGEMLWVSRINKAFKDERFVLYFQTIKPLHREKGLHYEILLRMLDEQGNLIPPGAFLPAAEHYDLAKKLDRWVIQAVFQWFSKHPEEYRKLDICSINLSGHSLMDQEFAAFVIQQFCDYSIQANKICFEVTETAAIKNLLLASKFIETLKKEGCLFALDDFGSGMSSFGYLKQLKIDFLKIDGLFVKDIINDPIDEAMVRSINEVGHTMGLKTIAEYVENDEILQKIAEIGVDFVQGYGIAKPQPIETLPSKVKKEE